MKVIIAGSRNLKFPLLHMVRAIDAADWTISEVVSGCARGVDEHGEAWAKRRDIPVKRFPADWDKHGRAAGPIRNREMAQYADALIAVWDGKSRGTKNMIEEMNKCGKPVFVRKVNL